MFKNSNRGISTLVAIGIIAFLVVVVGGGVLGYQYFLVPKNDNQQNNQNQNQQQTPPNNQVNDKQPSITVLSPNGGETWTAGSTHDITWTSTNLDSNTNVNIAFISGGTSVPIATVLNSSVYSWTLPFGNGATGLKISITSALNTSVSDTSDGTFTVAGNKQTAGWKTYTNTRYGFEIKYPSNYKSQEIPTDSPTGLSINLPRGNAVVHEIDNAIININLPDDCMFSSSALEDKNMLSFIEIKQINGINFYYYKNYLSQQKYLGAYCGMSSGCQSRDVYRTLYKGKCYEMAYDRSDRVFYGVDEYRGATQEEMKVPEIFNQIISTFKFIE